MPRTTWETWNASVLTDAKVLVSLMEVLFGVQIVPSSLSYSLDSSLGEYYDYITQEGDCDEAKARSCFHGLALISLSKNHWTRLLFKKLTRCSKLHVHPITPRCFRSSSSSGIIWCLVSIYEIALVSRELKGLHSFSSSCRPILYMDLCNWTITFVVKRRNSLTGCSCSVEIYIQ